MIASGSVYKTALIRKQAAVGKASLGSGDRSEAALSGECSFAWIAQKINHHRTWTIVQLEFACMREWSMRLWQHGAFSAALRLQSASHSEQCLAAAGNQ